MTDLILGCDVSKGELQVCMIDGCKDKIVGTRKFPNNPTGIESLLKWADGKSRGSDYTVIMEATGVYHENLVDSVYSHSVTAYVVTPKIIKHHIANHNRRYKNDRSDAYMIASFGMSIGNGLNKVDIKPWEPYSPFYAELRSYSRQIVSLQKTAVQMKNRMEALTSTGRTPGDIVESIQEIIDTIEDTIDAYERKLIETVDKDPTLKERIGHIVSIKGVGILTAIHVVAATDGFRLITGTRQLTAYAGLDIPENQSGRCSRPGHISKCGSSLIRRVLYMPAMASATSAHGIWHGLYLRIYEKSGGKGKKAITAVMRKMLCLMFILWNKQKPFDRDYKWMPTQASKSDILEAGASFVPQNDSNGQKEGTT